MLPWQFQFSLKASGKWTKLHKNATLVGPITQNPPEKNFEMILSGN